MGKIKFFVPIIGLLLYYFGDIEVNSDAALAICAESAILPNFCKDGFRFFVEIFLFLVRLMRGKSSFLSKICVKFLNFRTIRVSNNFSDC